METLAGRNKNYSLRNLQLVCLTWMETHANEILRKNIITTFAKIITVTLVIK